MNMIDQMQTWKHVFKLDPERSLSEKAIEQICRSGTDAIMVGGSSGITFENTVQLLSQIRRYEVPCVLEISNQDAIVPGFDYYFIPLVLNSKHSEWIVGHHQQAIKAYGHRLPWHVIAAEGYVVLNENSTVAQLTQADTSLDEADVTAYAKLAEVLLQLPIFYIEYSGSFGNMALVKKVARTLTKTRLFYGGGIRDLQSATQAAEAADTIVVGNIIYEHLQAALETVKIKKND